MRLLSELWFSEEISFACIQSLLEFQHFKYHISVVNHHVKRINFASWLSSEIWAFNLKYLGNFLYSLLMVFGVLTLFSVSCELYLEHVTCLVKQYTNKAFIPNLHHQRKDLLRNSDTDVVCNGKRKTGKMRWKQIWEKILHSILYWCIFNS